VKLKSTQHKVVYLNYILNSTFVQHFITHKRIFSTIEKNSLMRYHSSLQIFFLHFALKILEIAHAIPAFFTLTVEKNIYKSK